MPRLTPLCPRPRITRITRLALLALIAGVSRPTSAASLDLALSAIDTNDFFHHTRTLASDEFEGRAPGSAGEEKSVRYIADTFQRLGLEGGGHNGSWYQPVPLVGIRSSVSVRLNRPGPSGGAGSAEDWQFPQDYVAWSPRMQEHVSIPSSDLVFVGYGIVAPEYQWDDFKDVDVRGKTLLMLVNDPPLPDPQRPGELDPSQFRGRAMTYYGRWTYKFEIAAARGAAAALVIHETGPAGYPYFVVVNSWGRENFDLAADDGNARKVALAGWVSLDRARSLVAGSGLDFDTLKRSALRRDFRPVPLQATLTFDVTNRLRQVPSRNVIGRLRGAHPQRRLEYVAYSSHWDHLGRDDRLDGDRIFNGALDNATGIAALLELAEAFTRAPQRPDRTVLFLAVTAEEQGLLGAKYYAEHPLYPPQATLANLNLDGANVAGRQRDIGVVGAGLNTLEDLLVEAARTQQRIVRPEAEPEKGGYFRSDHFEFAKIGVPALYLDKTSDDILGRPPGYGRERREEYRERDYHKVTDEPKPWWDLAGAVEDTRLLFLVGWEVAHTSHWPEWKPGAEFKARRESSLGGQPHVAD